MAKGEKKSSKKDDTGVLGSLPATRPTRLGRRRAGGEAGAEESSPARAKAPAKRTTPTAKQATPAAKQATPSAKRATASKAKTTTSAKPSRSAASKPKATASSRSADSAAAKPAAPARPAPVAEVKPRPRTTTERKAGPRPVRSGSPGLDAVPVQERPSDPRTPSGTELVSTVVKAAGEVAQIGLTVGGQILKRAVDRIPKP